MGGSDVAQEELKTIRDTEKRARNVFWGSLLLSVLIVVHIAYLAGRSGDILGVLRSFLPPVLLWSLTMTAYAFFSLSRISQKKQLVPPSTDVTTGAFTLAYLRTWLEQERLHAFE